MDGNERELAERKTNPVDGPKQERATKSIVIGTDPFTMFQVGWLLTLLVVFTVVIPTVQWLREWLR